MIPYGRQHLDEGDKAAVRRVLDGDWLTQGPAVAEFEDALCVATGAEHAVSFSSGTAALHAATWAAGLGPGDLLVTSALSFVASANCGRYVGTDIGFVDVDASTLNLDPSAVPPEADALVAVHYAGLPVDLAALPTRPRVVIEDAAHALGAVGSLGPTGNNASSDLCCFSFHPVKAITTGEGGAVTTRSADLADRLHTFRHHGIRPDPERGGWYYDVEELGFNYRLTDLQAALGTSQLAKLDHFIERREHIAGRYRDLLADAAVTLPPPAPPGWRHAYHLFPVQVAERRRVYDGMRAAGIGVQVHYVPIHQLSIYRDIDARLPHTDAIYERLLSLPIHPELTEAEQDRVVDVLRSLT